jgi:hypothetical protein
LVLGGPGRFIPDLVTASSERPWVLQHLGVRAVVDDFVECVGEQPDQAAVLLDGRRDEALERWVSLSFF